MAGALPGIGLIIDVAFIATAFLFIYGLKRMSSPLTARSGIVTAGVGMLVAILASFLYVFGVKTQAAPHLPVNVALAAVALILGCGWAWRSGRKVAITEMPQMVALYNGMGGGAAAAIAAVDLLAGDATGPVALTIALLGGLIGSISLSGSVIAWAKLDGKLNKPLRLKGLQVINGLIMLATLAVGASIVAVSMQHPHDPASIGDVLQQVQKLDHTFLILVAVFFSGALLFGVMATLPIGGADMPVVISLYNAFTGLAVALEGYVLGNPALMIAGMVVGSAGTLLTLLMAKAMNRSVANILFSNFGDIVAGGEGEIAGSMRAVDAADAAVAMRYAGKVIIVPGFGLAAAQAQQKLFEFVKLLQAAGVEVKFAVHPVAGRMPGHMDVLLAEAGVPYDMIFELSEINDEFAGTDVAMVIGANDVVNPAARTDKSSPIYGMPILNVDKAEQVYVIKRGQGRGYAGVENALFYLPNTNMVYGDAKSVLGEMVKAVQDLSGGH